MVTKKVKSITAKELKFWLKGILEFQDAKWIPSLDQWKLIKQKIELLDDNENADLNQLNAPQFPSPPRSRTVREWQEPKLIPLQQAENEHQPLIKNPPVSNTTKVKMPVFNSLQTQSGGVVIEPPYDPSRSDFR